MTRRVKWAVVYKMAKRWNISFRDAAERYGRKPIKEKQRLCEQELRWQREHHAKTESFAATRIVSAGNVQKRIS